MNNQALFALAVCGFLTPIGTAAAQAITVGATSSTSDAPIYIADRKGYFRDEGLDVKVTNFRSAADMVAPLGAGQIEAGAGSASAGLYNAVARGIKIKIVADKASSPPGYGGTKILVRKDHVESGRYRSLQDLKGMKFAMNAPGVSNTSTLNTLLRSAGLSGALKNGRLDGANAGDVIAILSEATPIKSRDIYKLITPTGMNPDGRVNKASLAYDLAFYAEQGLIKGAVNLDETVDGSFVEAVLKELGPYRP